MNKLAEIVEYKKTIIKRDQQIYTFSQLEEMAAGTPPPLDFPGALRSSQGVGVIAEVKKASPSAGVIKSDNFDPVQIAKNYETAGADCISVLTDEKYFQGSLDYLNEIRRHVNIPILRKDFIIDRYQIIQARAAGADAVLLIAECLDDDQLTDLMKFTIQLGMTPLLELFEPANLKRSLAVQPKLLGINNRNLKNFETTLDQTVQLARNIPRDILLVSESAIKTAEDIKIVTQAGAKAVLVGETLMRTGNIQQVIDEFKSVPL